MEVTKNQTDDKLTVSIKGDIDSLTSTELDQELQGSLEGINDLTFDMQGVEYISSAGLRVILKAYKSVKEHGQMKIINVNETVKLIFKSTGLGEKLDIR